jgi:hypothetical protein
VFTYDTALLITSVKSLKVQALWCQSNKTFFFAVEGSENKLERLFLEIILILLHLEPTRKERLAVTQLLGL